MSEVNTYVVHRSQECLESLSDGTHSVSPEGEEGTTLGNGVESHSGGTIYCAQWEVAPWIPTCWYHDWVHSGNSPTDLETGKDQLIACHSSLPAHSKGDPTVPVEGGERGMSGQTT
eukprot:1464999-Rhodomonas_salina.4